GNKEEEVVEEDDGVVVLKTPELREANEAFEIPDWEGALFVAKTMAFPVEGTVDEVKVVGEVRIRKGKMELELWFPRRKEPNFYGGDIRRNGKFMLYADGDSGSRIWGTMVGDSWLTAHYRSFAAVDDEAVNLVRKGKKRVKAESWPEGGKAKHRLGMRTSSINGGVTIQKWVPQWPNESLLSHRIRVDGLSQEIYLKLSGAKFAETRPKVHWFDERWVSIEYEIWENGEKMNSHIGNYDRKDCYKFELDAWVAARDSVQVLLADVLDRPGVAPYEFRLDKFLLTPLGMRFLDAHPQYSGQLTVPWQLLRPFLHPEMQNMLVSSGHVK
ncbi:MAG: hypothetical protein AAF570_13180, partial [Bacteroidota bacterium]